MKLKISQWVLSPLPTASSASSCILQGESKLEERMTSNTYVFMFQVAEGLYAYTELVNPESSHFSGILQARAVCDLGGKAEVMGPEPLTPT